jgi:hypothetical protein
MNNVILEQEDGCRRVKFGPLVVDPRPLVDTDDENREYVALFNEDGAPNVGVSAKSPFWIVGSSNSPYDIYSYVVDGESDGAFSSGLTGTLRQSHAVVDGNGYLYFVTWKIGSTGSPYNAPSLPWRWTIRRVTPKPHSTVNVTLDARTLIPETNAWGNPFTDGINWDARFDGSFTVFGVAQNDGIVVFCRIRELGTSPLQQYLAVYLTRDLVVSHVEWLPVVDSPSSYLQSCPVAGHNIGVLGGWSFTLSHLNPAPLPDGYFVYTQSSSGIVSLRKFVGGAVTASKSLISPYTFPMTWGIWFHDDGSFWSWDLNDAAKSIKLFSSSLADITPGWASSLNGATINNYFATNSGISSDNFRFITDEEEGGANWYRVRDKSGSVLIEKRRSSSYYSGGWDTAKSVRIPGRNPNYFFGSNPRLGAALPTNICQSTGNQFVSGIYNDDKPTNQRWVAHKMSPDSLVASRQLSRIEPAVSYPGYQYSSLIMARGQWPHLDYSNWT